jgi:hypothetical protein
MSAATTPLDATFTGPSVNVASKEVRGQLSSLESMLTENEGGGSVFSTAPVAFVERLPAPEYYSF